MKWTKTAERKVKQRYAKEGAQKLAKEFGTTAMSVTAKARRLGADSTRKKPPKNFEWTEEMLTAIQDRYVSEGGKALAAEFGTTLDTVRRKAGTMGLHTIAGHAIWGKQMAESNTSCNIRYFDEWSPNMAYILGFLFADGCIDRRLTSVFVNLASKDESVLQFIRKELQIRSMITRQKGRLDNRTGNINQPQSLLHVCSIILVKGLMRLGMNPRKTYTNDPFPEIPERMLPHFVRGYLDGDGTTCITNRNVCCVGFVGSPNFITGLRDNLVRVLGVGSRVVQIHGIKTEWASVAWTSQKDLRSLHDFIYPEGFGFCLERKRANLVRWLISKNL